MEAQDTAYADYLWKTRFDVLYKSWVQLRYNRRRQRFFDLLDKGTKAFTLLLGASLLGGFVVAFVPKIGAAVSALGLLALIFGYGDRKQLHKELGERAAAIIQAVEKVPADSLTAAVVTEWSAMHAELLGKSPPALKTLTMMCEWEQSVAEGHRTHIRRPCWIFRVFCHFL